MTPSQSPIEAIRRDHAMLTAIRRDLHAHPELGMEEHRTAELVARTLEGWGIEVHRGVGKTGVVGVLRNGPGDRAAGGHGRAADPGGDRAAVGERDAGGDARVRA
jgi:metal-dependent amidase/aminoacylase/carboxypeptidase family protein